MSKINPYYYIFDEIGYPDDYQPAFIPENFKVYLLCDTVDKRKVFIYTDRDEFSLSSARDDEDVFRLFFSLSGKLEECDKANDLFFLADLHPIHYTKIDGKKIPVYRLRKNDLRVCLIQVDADLILFRLCTKRQDKIDKKQANIINRRVEAIYSHLISDRIIVN